jgi:GNAT superfamily N-acetyltransferase
MKNNVNEIIIKQADEKDIPVIEEILLDAVNWLHSTDKPMWSKERISWERLSQQFSPDNFYIAYIDGGTDSNPAGCMALVDYDPLIWSDLEKGQSLFVHKLAVKRFAAGRGVSKFLLEYAVNKCREKNIKTLRLDTDANRSKLMKLYEDFGFVCVDKKTLHIGAEKTFDLAYYVYDAIDAIK